MKCEQKSIRKEKIKMADSTLLTDGLKSALVWASNHIIEIIVFLSIFLEISKVKISPISSLIKFIFKPIRKELEAMREEFKKEIENLRKDLTSQIESLREDQEENKKAVNEMIKSNEMAEISRIRWEIIEFSNSLKNGQLHVRDEYRHIKDDHRKYEILIEKYNLENGITTEEMENIITHYEQNKHTNSVYF